MPEDNNSIAYYFDVLNFSERYSYLGQLAKDYSLCAAVCFTLKKGSLAQ